MQRCADSEVKISRLARKGDEEEVSGWPREEECMTVFQDGIRRNKVSRLIMR